MWRINDVIIRETVKKGLVKVNLEKVIDFNEANKFGLVIPQKLESQNEERKMQTKKKKESSAGSTRPIYGP